MYMNQKNLDLLLLMNIKQYVYMEIEKNRKKLIA